MNDITTMWVWIPRYKYVIFNGNNGTAEEQMINVTFEHGRETTGTVMCHDDIQTDDNSDYSEICTDTTNGGIKNFKSTYTHPAFCFGTKNEDGSCNGEELTGFWMAKFEMSTDDNDCNTNQNETNCNKTGLNIIVKPDQYSLRYENISTMFANIRSMEVNGNIHGFEQSNTATTWLDSSSNLTGEIANDNNTIDTHMIKNMEWGAVAYLSQSKYGKQGNSDYTDANKEVFINNNSTYKTGYSGGSYNSALSTTETYSYNNFINGGPGASTTGTVYGIYDMNGGTAEYVMGNMVDSSGNFYISNAGTWTSANYPINKYYDKYSYNIEKTSLTRGKLGDGTKEVTKNFSSENGRWYSDFNYFPAYVNSWILRSGCTWDTTASGLYYMWQNVAGDTDSTRSSRPVLTVSRNMPWLNNN